MPRGCIKFNNWLNFGSHHGSGCFMKRAVSIFLGVAKGVKMKVRYHFANLLGGNGEQLLIIDIGRQHFEAFCIA